jgi:hypothetical protein
MLISEIHCLIFFHTLPAAGKERVFCQDGLRNQRNDFSETEIIPTIGETVPTIVKIIPTIYKIECFFPHHLTA